MGISWLQGYAVILDGVAGYGLSGQSLGDGDPGRRAAQLLPFQATFGRFMTSVSYVFVRSAIKR